jgi:hypothetical protein
MRRREDLLTGYVEVAVLRRARCAQYHLHHKGSETLKPSFLIFCSGYTNDDLGTSIDHFLLLIHKLNSDFFIFLKFLG